MEVYIISHAEAGGVRIGKHGNGGDRETAGCN